MMIQNKVLFIGLVWPEPTSSAAGKRILQLVDFFVRRGTEVTFASAAIKTASSFDFAADARKRRRKKVREVQIELNNSSFDEFILELRPDIVVFDRFFTEEQFGWRVTEQCPGALQILDTEDLHSLRLYREAKYKNHVNENLFGDIALREASSIIRCDLTLMISEFEMDILKNQFNLPPHLLYYLPFLENLSGLKNRELLPFEERKDFIFIGNYLHRPNWETLRYLKTEIWPKIRKKLPKAELKIFGAYSNQRVFDLNNEKQGFRVFGKAENAVEEISKTRVLLAPLVYGAGQKGKFIDAMEAGTPIATNAIGTEGMFTDEIPGFAEEDEEKFIKKAVELYQNEKIWTKAQKIGTKVLKENFDRKLFEKDFEDKLKDLRENLHIHREQNLIAKILKHNSHNALKYMSLWIEEKNKG